MDFRDKREPEALVSYCPVSWAAEYKAVGQTSQSAEWDYFIVEQTTVHTQL